MAPPEGDAERTDPSLRLPGRSGAAEPGQSASTDDEDDDSGPSTAPQPRITVAPKERAQESSAASRTTVFPVAGQEGSESGEKPSGPKRPDQGASTVKVIVGTRRYHGADCPLIKGAGDSGVETMTVTEAKAAGLTICPICRHDRESVS